MPSEVAPGVYRVGNAYINCYLIEDGNDLTLVDAGVKGFRAGLEEDLRRRGRSVSDIAAVLLTHGHPDHVGMAEGLRVDAPAPVYVHEADAEMARTGKVHELEGTMLAYVHHPAMWKLLAMGARTGAFRTPKIAAVTTFTDGDLDVPGRPRVVPCPGHSPGTSRSTCPSAACCSSATRSATTTRSPGRGGRSSCPRRSPPISPRRSRRWTRSPPSRRGRCCSATANPGRTARPQRSLTPEKSG